MRLLFVLSLAICLLFSISTMACADIFRITPEVSKAAFETSGSEITPFSDSGNVYNLSGDLNFVLIRVGADLGYGDVNGFDYAAIRARIGTEIPLVLFKLIAFAGYQDYALEKGVTYEFKGTVVGVGGEFKLNKLFSVRGVTVIPVDMKYEGLTSDDEADFSSTKIDLIFTTLPLVDFFVGYQKTEAKSDNLNLDVSGLTAGVRIGL